MLHRACRVLAIADDMTGALEAGAKLAPLGSLVTTQTELRFSVQNKVIVMDTETRHVSSREAAEKTYRIAQAARQLQTEIIYKKTDSTLRGNIGPEIHALARAYPERPIVFLPAYPRLGRTVRGGYLYIDGQPVNHTPFAHDALNPVKTHSVPEVLGNSELSIHLDETGTASTLQDGHVHVFDSETDADIAAVIQWHSREPHGRFSADLAV